ncbi:MAG TPA: hypothetical protein VM661_04820 [Candidatus Sulfotelmatobacter sp.]|jgi:hypothetical protein|nr:hypothetical protein [Candidatus Sulfotelmatobacter sp.]
MRRCVNGLKAAAFALLTLLAACKDDSGPVEIKYGREACEMCGMIISDPHYAVELRGGPENRIKKFDDVGDAVTWMEKKGWGLAATKEIWVMNSEDGKTWLDGRKAFFIRGTSPMDYGFAAVTDHREGSLTFDEMRTTVLARGSTSMCAPGQDSGQNNEAQHNGGVKP